MRRSFLILAATLASIPAGGAVSQTGFALSATSSKGSLETKSIPGGIAPMPVTPPPTEAGAAHSAPAKNDDTVTYDSGPAQYIDQTHQWKMTGGVSFVQDDSTLQTQSALVNLDADMKAKNAEALAPVHLWNTDDDLTGTHGYIDFTTHIATIKDHITLIAKPSTKPQPDGSVRKQFKDPATITCDEIIYNYKNKTGKIPGPLTVHQKDRTVTADSGDYDGNRKEVVLRGHVHGTLKDGSVIDSPVVRIGIDEGHEWIYLPTHTHGVFSTKDHDDGDNSDDNGDDKESPAPPPALPPIPETPEAPTPSTTGTAGTPKSGTAPSTPATPPSTAGQ